MKTRIVVVGVGYMGFRHAVRYLGVPQAKLVAVVDSNEVRAAQVANELGCRWFGSVEALLESGVPFNAASVATPTGTHVEVATKLLRAGKHCLIEKPLAESSVAASKLMSLAKSLNRIAMPGHIERFNPGIRAVFGEGRKIKYLKSDRVGPLSFRSTDSDVIMDVMIHDIDLCRLFFEGKASVDVVRAVSSPPGINDIANVHLRFSCGGIADLTASRLAISRRRKLRMFGDDVYYSVDCEEKSAYKIERVNYYSGLRVLKMYQDTSHEPTSSEIFDAVGAEPIAGAGREDAVDPLVAELSAFVNSISGGEVLVGPADGVRAIAIAETILSSLKNADLLVPEDNFRGE